MKQALVSLIRAVTTFARNESAAAKVACLPELSVVELRQVTGGAGLDLPKNGW